MPEGTTEISPHLAPKELPNGFEITQVNGPQMNELLKKAPAIVKWPFVEDLGDSPRMNVGASSCLMTYEVGRDEARAGHFTVVAESKVADAKEQSEYDMYKNWLAHVNSLLETDDEAVVVLLGQHKSNLKAHFDSKALEDRWTRNRKQVNEDLLNLDIDPSRVIDLRGQKMGSTAALYDPTDKRLYYTDYPAK